MTVSVEQTLDWIQVTNELGVARAPYGGFYSLFSSTASFELVAMWRESHATDPLMVYGGSSLWEARQACERDALDHAAREHMKHRKAMWYAYMAEHDPPSTEKAS